MSYAEAPDMLMTVHLRCYDQTCVDQSLNSFRGRVWDYQPYEVLILEKIQV